jgi:hypothetical protein
MISKTNAGPLLWPIITNCSCIYLIVEYAEEYVRTLFLLSDGRLEQSLLLVNE